MVKGKIVVCTVEKITDNATQLGVYTRNIGGVGMILVEPLAQDLVFQFGTQATLIGQDELEEIQKYIATERYVSKSPKGLMSTQQLMHFIILC